MNSLYYLGSVSLVGKVFDIDIINCPPAYLFRLLGT